MGNPTGYGVPPYLAFLPPDSIPCEDSKMNTQGTTRLHYHEAILPGRQIQPGLIVDNRFYVQHRIGLGGMGAVFCVRDSHDNCDRAMKVCLSPPDDRRFDREVRNMRKVDHPNVLPVLSASVMTVSSSVRSDIPEYVPYFIMPLATKSLAEEIPDIAGDTDSVLRILRQIVDGLTAIHETGMIHRDIKPQNVLLIDGKWCVADLGLSVLTNRETTALTQTGQFLGTINYAAPEQLTDTKQSTIRTDVFQLGSSYTLCTQAKIRPSGIRREYASAARSSVPFESNQTSDSPIQGSCSQPLCCKGRRLPGRISESPLPRT